MAKLDQGLHCAGMPVQIFCVECIAGVKVILRPKSIDSFLFFSPGKCMLWVLIIEAPHQGASDEYPQLMLSWRNKRNIYLDTCLI